MLRRRWSRDTRFCHGSGKGYGACVFVRVVWEHWVTVKLWTSKWRLAPVKEISIPRLELLVFFLLSKLITLVKTAGESEVEIVRVFCWTDSQIVLWWMRQVHKEWKVWVQTGSRKFRRVSTVKTGFMHQPCWMQQIFVPGSVRVKGLKNVCCGRTVQKFCWLERICGHPRIFCCQRTRTSIRKIWVIVVEKAVLTSMVSKKRWGWWSHRYQSV